MKIRVRICGLFISVSIMIGSLGMVLPEKSESQKQLVQSKAANEEEVLTIHAMSAVLLDADSGRVLYGKEAQVFRPMASTTKIMTCILALENGNLQDICTASDYAAAQPKVHLGISKGRQFYLKDLLYSLMLESHNDAAVMIAEQIGGSVEGFAAMMNQKARDIGCLNTNFVTPNGLDATVTTDAGTEYIHGTTAEDLARIMRYCINRSPKKEEFLTITQTANYAFSDVSGKYNYHCSNHNALLSMMPGAISGKTGFTNGAGYSYVGALENEGRTYIIALLASGWPPHKTYKWADARVLFNYGTENYHYRDIFEDLGNISVSVENGIPNEGEDEAIVNISLGLPPEEKTWKILLKDSEMVRIEKNIPSVLPAPVKKDQIVGSVDYYLDNQLIQSWPVFTQGNVDEKDLSYYLELVWEHFRAS